MQNPNDYGFVGNRINSIRDTFFWDTAGLENDPKRIQSVANLLRLTSPLADRVLSIDWLSEDEDELQSAIGTFEGLIATDCIKRNNLVAVPDLQIILRGFGQDNDETNYVIPADAIEYAEFPASNNPLNYDRMIFYKYLLDIVGDRQEYTDTFSSIHRFIVDKVSKGSTCIGRRVDIAYVIGYEQVEVPEAVKIDTPDDIPLLDMPVVKRIKGRVLGYEPIVDDDNEICMSVIIEPDDNSEMIVSVPVDLITEGDFSEYLPMEVDQGLLSEEHNLFYDSLSAFCEILQQKYGEVVDVQEYNEQVLKFVSTLMSKLNIAHKNTYFVNNHAMSVHQRVLRDVEVEFATVDADVELTAISDVLDYTIGTWRFSEQHDISGDMKGYVVIATIHDDDDEIFDETNFSLRRVIEVSDPFYDFVLQSGYRGYLLVPSSEVINSRLHKNNYN